MASSTPWWQATTGNTSVDTSSISSAIASGTTNINSAISNINSLGSGVTDTTTPSAVTSGIDNLGGISSRLGALSNKQVSASDISRVDSLRPNNPYEQSFASGLSMMQGYANGDSPVDRNIANQTLNSFNASQAASNLSQAQRIASNPNLSEGAKGAAMAQLNSTSAEQRSQLEAGLASGAQTRAFQAAQQFSQIALQGANYDEAKFQSDLSQVNTETTQNINALIAQGNVEQSAITDNLNIWNTQISTKLADASRSLSAAVSAGGLTEQLAGLQLQGATAQVDAAFKQVTANLDAIQTANASVGISNTLFTTATSMVSDFRTQYPNATVNDIESNPPLMAAIKAYYQHTTGNSDYSPTADDINAFISSGRTPGETSVALTNDKIESMSGDFMVGQPGGMTTQEWGAFTNHMKMINDVGGNATFDSTTGAMTVYNANGSVNFSVTSGGTVNVTNPGSTSGVPGTYNVSGGDVIKYDSNGNPYEATDAIVGSNGVAVYAPSGTTGGQFFIGQDGQNYILGSDGKPQMANISSIFSSPNGWDSIQGIASGTPAYNTLFSSAPKTDLNNKNGYVGEVNSVVALSIGGQNIIGQVTQTSSPNENVKIKRADGSTYNLAHSVFMYTTTITKTDGTTMNIANINSENGEYLIRNSDGTWTPVAGPGAQS